MSIRNVAVGVALAALLGAGVLLWRAHRTLEASAPAPAASAESAPSPGVNAALGPESAPAAQAPALTDEQKRQLVERWKAANPEPTISLIDEQDKLAAQIRNNYKVPPPPPITFPLRARPQASGQAEQQ